MTVYTLTFSCPDCGLGCNVRITPRELVTITHPLPLCPPAENWVGWLEQGVRMFARRGDPPPATPDDVSCDAPPEDPR